MLRRTLLSNMADFTFDKEIVIFFQTIVSYLLFLSNIGNANRCFTVLNKSIAICGVQYLTLKCGRLNISVAHSKSCMKHFIVLIFCLPPLITLHQYDVAFLEHKCALVYVHITT